MKHNEWYEKQETVWNIGEGMNHKERYKTQEMIKTIELYEICDDMKYKMA